MKPPKSVPAAPPSPLKAPHQFSIAFESIQLRGLSPTERAKVLAHLAKLLMQAAGTAMGECDDDKH